MTREEIARVAHEVNRAYCQALGDSSQPAWENAPQWQRDSAMLGVQLHLENPEAGAQASHESWMAQKLADGWEYGPTKDPQAKYHPCIVPFDSLPVEQQAKDYLFRGVVHALADVERASAQTLGTELMRQCQPTIGGVIAITAKRLDGAREQIQSMDKVLAYVGECAGVEPGDVPGLIAWADKNRKDA